MLTHRQPLRSGLVLLGLLWFGHNAFAEACSITKVGQAALSEERGLFLLSAVLDDKAQMQFLVDTGATKSAIDWQMASALRLPVRSQRQRRLIGIDGKPGRAFSDVTVRYLTFGWTEHFDFAMAVGDKVIDGKRSVIGTMGADLLANYDLEFDYRNKRLHLYRVKNCSRQDKDFRPWVAPYDSVPLTSSDKAIVSLPVLVDGKPLNMALDTGATRTTISLEAARKLGLDVEKLKAEAPRSTGYSGSGAAVTHHARRFDRIRIGQSDYANIELTIAGIDVEPYDGLLGMDFLRSRRIWISYATRQLLVKHPQ